MTKQEANRAVNRFVKNVSALSKAEKKSIITERKAGVSPGYLGRALKKEQWNIGLATALLFADAVGEKLEDLLAKDYTQIYYDKKIEKLEAEIARLRKEKEENESIKSP